MTQTPDKQQVALGSTVKLTGFVPGEEEVFEVVDDISADYAENKIPVSSPLAQAILGAKEGDQVRFNPPGGEVQLTVLEVEAS